MRCCASPTPQRWAEQQCSGAERSDGRRTERIGAMAAAMAATPGGCSPTLLAHP